MRLLARLVALTLAVAAGCDSEPGDLYPVVFGGDRPARLLTPADYDPGRPAPLVVALHGYGSSGDEVLELTGLDRLPDERYAMVIAPDGVADSEGRNTWNGTDVCCDFDGAGTDDVGYLVDLVDEAASSWAIDLDRVFVVGFSAGGFMAYRLACDRADRVAGVVSIAGASFLDAAACDPGEPVRVLHLHGDKDVAILYDGNDAYPGARGSTDRWAGYNDCGTLTSDGGRLDLDLAVDGAETRREIYPGCPTGGSVELWTLEGSKHQPRIRQQFRDPLWSWMQAM